MIEKLLICPYFGEYPSWMEHFLENAKRLQPLGYSLLIDDDEDAFRDRVREKLEIEPPELLWGTGKTWDFRPALGCLYQDELEGRHFDFWGHVDFDVVFGRVDQFVTDEFLQPLDMHSNCPAYVNGSWSLYRNTPQMCDLFKEEPHWAWYMEAEEPNGWAEKSFSRLISHGHKEGRLKKAWTEWQVYQPALLAGLYWEDEKLMCQGVEQMMAHFRRTKVYPPRLLP